MISIAQCFCPNKSCKDYGLTDHGNLNMGFAYGKHANHMLYCRTCKTRFSETKCSAFFGTKYSSEHIGAILRTTAEGAGVRATARILDLDKNAVNRVILKAGEHCARVLDSLLVQLNLTQVQLDELWTFLEKKTLPMLKKGLLPEKVRSGSGRL